MFFFKPNIEKLVRKNNVKGLIKALAYKDDTIKFGAVKALCRTDSQESNQALHQFFENPQYNLDTFLSTLKTEIIDEKKEHEEVWDWIDKKDDPETWIGWLVNMSDSLFAFIYLLVEFKTDDNLNQLHQMFIDTIENERKVLALIIKKIGLDRFPDGSLWLMMLDEEMAKGNEKEFKSNLSLPLFCLNSKDKDLRSHAMWVLFLCVDETNKDICETILDWLKKEPENYYPDPRQYALWALVKIECPNFYSPLLKLYKTLSKKDELKKEILKELPKSLADMPFKILISLLGEEEDTDILLSLTKALPSDCPLDQALKLIPVIHTWIDRFEESENRPGYLPLFENCAWLLKDFNTEETIKILLAMPEWDLKKRIFSNYRVEMDHPQRNELLGHLYRALEEREQYIYPVLIKSPGITEDLIRLLTKKENQDRYQWDEILEIVTKKNNPQTKHLLSKYFNQIPSPEHKIKLSELISPVDESSDIYPWVVVDNKEWEKARNLDKKAIPALEYTLFLAEETANQVQPEPPYSESDIRILLSLWHDQFPDKLLFAFHNMEDSNNLKPKILKFLIQKDPSCKTELKKYIDRQNENITGAVSYYIDELKHIKDHQDYLPESDCPNNSEPRLICEKIGQELKTIVDFKMFPAELKQEFRENAWLFSHKFWDGTNLFSVIKSMRGKLSRKVNKALSN